MKNGNKCTRCKRCETSTRCSRCSRYSNVEGCLKFKNSKMTFFELFGFFFLRKIDVQISDTSAMSKIVQKMFKDVQDVRNEIIKFEK